MHQVYILTQSQASPLRHLLIVLLHLIPVFVSGRNHKRISHKLNIPSTVLTSVLISDVNRLKSFSGRAWIYVNRFCGCAVIVIIEYNTIVIYLCDTSILRSCRYYLPIEVLLLARYGSTPTQHEAIPAAICKSSYNTLSLPSLLLLPWERERDLTSKLKASVSSLTSTRTLSPEVVITVTSPTNIDESFYRVHT